jgi:hypothetical protein
MHVTHPEAPQNNTCSIVAAKQEYGAKGRANRKEIGDMI